MAKFIKYSPETILSLRPSKDEIISEKLSKHFDWINELFLQSTQYQENRKKINYNQINSQKWRSINNNIVNSILLMLNSLDQKLYDETESKILGIDIKDINNMRKIVEIIHEKSCESYNVLNVLNLYIKLLARVIENGKWYYKIGDKITDYICPRIVAVSIAQKNYLEMLDTFLIIVENFNKTKDEVSYFKIKNQKFIGNMLFIGKLYNYKIISTEIINNICKNIVDKVKEDNKNADLIEYLISLLQIIEDYPNLKNVVNEIYEIQDTLPSRIKIIFMNYNDNIDIKKEEEEKEREFKRTNETYNNLITEYLISGLMNEFTEAIKGKVDGEIVQSILRKYNMKSEDKLITFINELKERNILQQEYMNSMIKEYEENGELEEIAEECPAVYKFVEKIKK